MQNFSIRRAMERLKVFDFSWHVVRVVSASISRHFRSSAENYQDSCISISMRMETVNTIFGFPAFFCFSSAGFGRRATHESAPPTKVLSPSPPALCFPAELCEQRPGAERRGWEAKEEQRFEPFVCAFFIIVN